LHSHAGAWERDANLAQRSWQLATGNWQLATGVVNFPHSTFNIHIPHTIQVIDIAADLYSPAGKSAGSLRQGYTEDEAVIP
tara:strand:+ start:4215 stop:4457 length:243 start_codon:yes stop_codon:yes gene_type:complete